MKPFKSSIVILNVLFLVLGSTVNAESSKSASSSSSSSSSSGGGLGLEYLIIGGGSALVFKEESQQIVDFRHLTNYFLVGEGSSSHRESNLKGHFGLIGFGSQAVSVNLSRTSTANGQPLQNQPVDFYFLGAEVGLVAQVRVSLLQPWLGGGVLGGNSVVSDPAERNLNNMFVAVDRDSKWADGFYFSGGIDFLIPYILGSVKNLGFRAGYTHYFLRTDRHDNLYARESMRFQFEALSGALMIIF